MRYKEILADVLEVSMHNTVAYKGAQTRNGKEILFFDNPRPYYGYLIFAFYLRDETVCECENCNRLSVSKTKKKALYCDRVFNDGKTCRQIGPAQKYEALAENDIVL